MNALTSYTSDLVSRYDQEAFLGQLCWYYFPNDVRITIPDWMKAAIDAGIDSQVMMPTRRRTVDAFKRAVAAQKLTTSFGDQVFRISARDAGYDEDAAYRVLAVEILDREQHRLVWGEGVRFSFDRRTSAITAIAEPLVDQLPNEARDHLNSCVDDITERYNIELGLMTHGSCREMVRRRLINGMDAIQAHPSGGLYFVFRQHTEQLVQLADMVNLLDNGCQMHVLPLLDDQVQRDRIRDAFEADCVAEVNRVLTEIKGVLDSGDEITSDRAQGYYQKFQDIRKKLAGYSDLLETALEQTGARLEILQMQTLAVFERVNV